MQTTKANMLVKSFLFDYEFNEHNNSAKIENLFYGDTQSMKDF